LWGASGRATGKETVVVIGGRGTREEIVIVAGEKVVVVVGWELFHRRSREKLELAIWIRMGRRIWGSRGRR
jgi:hypothetical protein